MAEKGERRVVMKSIKTLYLILSGQVNHFILPPQESVYSFLKENQALFRNSNFKPKTAK